MPPRVPSCPSISTLPKPSIRTHCKSCLNRSFSSSPTVFAEGSRQRQPTLHRRKFYQWLEGPGEVFRHPLPNSTNYLNAYDKTGNLLRAAKRGEAPASTSPETADSRALDAAAEGSDIPKETAEDLRPFPMNAQFTSQSILSEDFRLEIWRRVQESGKSVRQVSAEMGVDMRRVAAVVRLVEVERRMKAEEEQLAIPYARAIHAMVPTTELDPNTRKPTDVHEPINDLEQHPLTLNQIFYPASESRSFNRTDAGRVFSGAPRLPDDEDIGQGGTGAVEPWQDTKPELVGKPGREKYVLKPADSRIPHPHLIAYAKDKDIDRGVRQERYHERLREDQDLRAAARAKREAYEESKKTRVDGDRWQFVVTDVQATRQGTGLDGRGVQSPGFRYGVPSQDRKRGHVKIPTKVEV